MRSDQGDKRRAEAPLIRDWSAGRGSQCKVRVDVSEVETREWLRQTLARKVPLAPSLLVRVRLGGCCTGAAVLVPQGSALGADKSRHQGEGTRAHEVGWVRLAPESPIELWQPGLPPSKLWRKCVCRMEQTHTEKQGEVPESKVSRSQEPGCTLSPGLGVPGLPLSVQQTLLS